MEVWKVLAMSFLRGLSYSAPCFLVVIFVAVRKVAEAEGTAERKCKWRGSKEEPQSNKKTWPSIRHLLSCLWKTCRSYWVFPLQLQPVNAHLVAPTSTGGLGKLTSPPAPPASPLHRQTRVRFGANQTVLPSDEGHELLGCLPKVPHKDWPAHVTRKSILHLSLEPTVAGEPFPLAGPVPLSGEGRALPVSLPGQPKAQGQEKPPRPSCLPVTQQRCSSKDLRRPPEARRPKQEGPAPSIGPQMPNGEGPARCLQGHAGGSRGLKASSLSEDGGQGTGSWGMQQARQQRQGRSEGQQGKKQRTPPRAKEPAARSPSRNVRSVPSAGQRDFPPHSPPTAPPPPQPRPCRPPSEPGGWRAVLQPLLCSGCSHALLKGIQQCAKRCWGKLKKKCTVRCSTRKGDAPGKSRGLGTRGPFWRRAAAAAAPSPG